MQRNTAAASATVATNSAAAAARQQPMPLPAVSAQNAPAFIPLGQLIDFAVQQIYHDLTVLSELLPKKDPADRKISLVNFAQNTRVLFVRLLAVVKWVKTSKKLDVCTSICSLLDQQATLFVDTADRLVQMARHDLVVARLAPFQVCSAVDVLTQGTFSRLPLCIKDRFVTSPPITNRERAIVLQRLNQVLATRLSRASSRMPPHIKEVAIQNGMVRFTVPGEFETVMTLLGETDSTKWALLNIKMLVEDFEIGYGTQLVHPLQLNMLHQVLQSRMDASAQPLNEMYTFLHSFAQSLQLDVLFCQSTQLVSGRLRGRAIIESYEPIERTLLIGYWMQTDNKVQRPQNRLKVMAGVARDPYLRVSHWPAVKGLPSLDTRTGRLSIERLLAESCAVRVRERLLRHKRRLEAAVQGRGGAVGMAGENLPFLTYPLLHDLDEQRSEMLELRVDLFSGQLLATCDAFDDDGCPELAELEKALTKAAPVAFVEQLIDKMRRARVERVVALLLGIKHGEVRLVVKRFKAGLSPLIAREVSETSVSVHATQIPGVTPDQERVIVQFVKHEHYLLVLSFSPLREQPLVRLSIHLLCTANNTHRLLHLTSPDADAASGVGSATADRQQHRKTDSGGGGGGGGDWSVLGQMIGSSAVSELTSPTGGAADTADRVRRLAALVTALDEQIGFVRLCEELDRRQLKYRFAQHEDQALQLQLTQLPAVFASRYPDLMTALQACNLRVDLHRIRIWPFEITLESPRLQADFSSSDCADF